MYKGIQRYKLNGKTTAHRDSVIRSQVLELVINQKIKTTPIKAKIVKAVFDRLVTKGKKEGVGARREIEAFFGGNKRSVERFYNVLEAQLGNRTSGYTRVFKTLPRKGDGAEQVFILLTDIVEKTQKSQVDKLLEKKEKNKGKRPVRSKKVLNKK